MNARRQGSFTILVIDDDEMVRDTVAELLQTADHRVVTAASGADGLTMARSVRPDLILVDHHMPVMSGLEVVHALKADDATRRIPVIALTSAGAEEANELSRAGCIAFIPKPFDPDEFRRLIADIVNVTVWRTPRAEP